MLSLRVTFGPAHAFLAGLRSPCAMLWSTACGKVESIKGAPDSRAASLESNCRGPNLCEESLHVAESRFREDGASGNQGMRSAALDSDNCWAF